MTVMPSISQSLDAHEQNGKEVAGRDISDKIVASPPGITHSTLEARHPDPVLYDSFKQAIPAQSRPSYSAEEPKATENVEGQSSYQVLRGRRPMCRLQPLWFWLILVSAAAAIGIVVGAVVGTIVHRDKGNDKQTTSGGTTGQLIPSNSSHPATVTKMNDNSAVASVAWHDIDNNPQYRLYWQGEDSTIRESVWNATKRNWTASSSPIGYARPNAPMAAVVTGPAGFPFVSKGMRAE